MANIISFLLLIVSITIHEFSHALVADRLGDPTPRSYGRLTLNPVAHADLIGTVILPILAAFSGFPVLGWAKPVPIDPYNFSNPKRDELLVALAGPGSNFLLALFSSLLFHLLPGANSLLAGLVLINLTLGVFNLFPIPPLDGSKILLNLLPSSQSYQWSRILDQYGFLLLFLLLIVPIGGTSLLNAVLYPIVRFFAGLLLS